MNIISYGIMLVLAGITAISVHHNNFGSAMWSFGVFGLIGIDAIVRAIKESKVVNKPA